MVLMIKDWKKINSWKKKIFFWSEIAIYLFLGLHKGRLSSSRSLHPSKENIWHFKTWIFFIFVGNFGPPGTGSGSVFPMRIRIQIQLTKMNADRCGSGSATLKNYAQNSYMGLLKSRKNLADLYISRLEHVGTAVSSKVGNTSSNLNRTAQLKAVIGGHRSFLKGREHLVKP
jgi:hypothetical protein